MHRRRSSCRRRRGLVAVMVTVLLVTLLGMAALSLDVGAMYRARHEAQVSADAAAMAAAWELLDGDILRGAADPTEELAAARASASAFAADNLIMRARPALDQANDVQIGYMDDPSDPAGVMTFGDPTTFNSVSVIVRRNAAINGPIDLYFAGIFGITEKEVSARAVATFKNGVVGFSANPETGTSSLLPLALHVDAWTNLLSGAFTHGDGYGYNEANNSVSANGDDINELSMYPDGGGAQLPPGSFGTVDFGDGGNSAADLARQILFGVNEADMAYHGGEITLGEDGTLTLEGDTGLSAGIQDELQEIIGIPRTIPLFDFVENPGNNARFRIVGFAGIRIMHVRLNGNPNQKHVLIQPAFAVDRTAITGPGSGSSYFVYEPVQLVQ